MATSGSSAVRILASTVHPGAPGSGSEGKGTVDVGLARLDRPLPGISSARLSTLVPPEGAPVVAVGYGFDGKGPDGMGARGRRLSAPLRAGGIDRSTGFPLLEVPPLGGKLGCPGDSGSPLFFQDRVVGVLQGGLHADGENITCRNALLSYYTPVQAVAGWIRTAVARLRAPRGPSATFMGGIPTPELGK